MRRRVVVPVVVLLTLCCLVAAVALLAYFFYVPAVEARPVVLISSPRYGEQVELGETVTIQAIARDEAGVVRVELWVDGELEESQASTLPGGTSPFPLIADWRPSSPGTHTLIVRAFNGQNARAYASVNVEAIELADRDGDGVADQMDACPDQPGLPEADGCAVFSEGDRDGDGVLDDVDVCPDEPGSPLSGGCPDADADEVADADDLCPDEPGLPDRDGCPTPGDLDDDGVADEQDDCREEWGLPENAGCPDRDGDGMRDVDDDCPDEPGVPQHGGCRDRDSDGVADADDLRPDEPGRVEDHGAPDSGAPDSDGDGVPDDVDECDGEEGLPENAGCPPPGDGSDADGGLLPLSPWEELEPLGGGFFGPLDPPGVDDVIMLTPVEVEALEFEVFDDYAEIYCYAGLMGGLHGVGMERYGPIPRLGPTRWDIAEVLGGENSRHFSVPMDEPLELQVECEAYRGAEPPIDLGLLTLEHPPEDWDGEVCRAWTEGEPGGPPRQHRFQVQYRICAGSCEEGGLPPPILWTPQLVVDHLSWDWRGVWDDITGFKLYVNGSHVGNFERGSHDRLHGYDLPESLLPACGQRLEFEVTAFRGDPFDPDQESPTSNAVVSEGPPCPRRVRVTFLDVETLNWPGDPPSQYDDGCWEEDLGPIDLYFVVNDGSDAREFVISTVYGHSRLCTRSNACNRIQGYCLHPHTTHSIADIVEFCRDTRDGLSGRRAEQLSCPDNNFVEVALGSRDDLYLYASIGDADTDGTWQRVMNGSLILEPDELVPGAEYERTLLPTAEYVAEVTVRIEVLPAGS